MTGGCRVTGERPQRHPAGMWRAGNLLTFILVAAERLISCSVEEEGCCLCYWVIIGVKADVPASLGFAAPQA